MPRSAIEGEKTQRDREEAEERRRDDRAAAADRLREASEENAAEDRADVRDDREQGDGADAEAALLLQKRWIEILRAVRHEVEAGHQRDRVDEERGLGAERGDQARARVRVARARAGLPRGRLGHVCADVEHEERRERPRHEHPAPAEVREDQVVDDRREQIAERVAFLQQPREGTAGVFGDRLHRERRTDAPLAAHRDAVERAQQDERGEVRRERRRELDDRIEDDVDHQRPAATVTIGGPAEDQRAEWPQHQRHRDREGDRGNRLHELFGDGAHDEDEQKEVERVEHPAGERGQERAPLHGLERAQKRDGIGQRHGAEYRSMP